MRPRTAGPRRLQRMCLPNSRRFPVISEDAAPRQYRKTSMSLRPITLVAVFAAGVGFAVWGLGATGPRVLITSEPKPDAKTQRAPEKRPTLRMDDERIALAGIGRASCRERV